MNSHFQTLTIGNITLALMGVLFYFLVNISRAKTKKKKEFSLRKYTVDNWLNITISIFSIFPLLIIAQDLVPIVNSTIAFSVGFLNSSLLRSILVMTQNLLQKNSVQSDTPQSDSTHGDSTE